MCMAAVLIFMELPLEKSKNNFVQLVNKLCCFFVHIIRVLDGEKENAPQVFRQGGRKEDVFAILLFLLKEMDRNR